MPGQMFGEILRLIDGLRLSPAPGLRERIARCIMTTGGVCPNAKKILQNQSFRHG